MTLINTKQTRPGMSMTEQITLMIDVPGRVCFVNEKLSFPQVVCVILIVTGIAGLKILAKERGV